MFVPAQQFPGESQLFISITAILDLMETKCSPSLQQGSRAAFCFYEYGS